MNDEEAKVEAEKHWHFIEQIYLQELEQKHFLYVEAIVHGIKHEREKPNELRPKIVCLCGSTRFVDIFNEWRKKLTLEGKIVLSIEIVTTQTQKENPQFCNTKLKEMLNELHLRKIDLADEVFILNVGHYIGESTRKEIDYALAHNKQVKYLEPEENKW